MASKIDWKNWAILSSHPSFLACSTKLLILSPTDFDKLFNCSNTCLESIALVFLVVLRKSN